jgi:hypothetical protein
LGGRSLLWREAAIFIPFCSVSPTRAFSSSSMTCIWSASARFFEAANFS